MSTAPPISLGRRAGALLAFAWTLLVIAATTVPDDPANSSSEFLCLTCSAVAAADVVRNLLLYVPIGVSLALRGSSLGRAVIGGLLLSAALEALQAMVPGRSPSLRDILMNGAGTAAGVLLWRIATARPRISSRTLDLAAGAWALAWVLQVLVHGWLETPSLPEGATWHGVYAMQSGSMSATHALIETAQLGDLTIAPGRLPDSDAARRLLLAAAPLTVVLRPGPRVEGLAPWLSLVDDDQEILLVASNGDALTVRVLTRGRAASFEATDVRADAFLRGTWGSDTMRIEVSRGEDGLCFERAGLRRCGLGRPVGRGWGHIVPMRSIPERGRLAMDAAWLLASGLGLGFFLRRSWAGAAAVAIVGGALAVLPPRIGLQPVTALEAASLVTGVVVGMLGARLFRRPGSADRVADGQRSAEEHALARERVGA